MDIATTLLLQPPINPFPLNDSVIISRGSFFLDVAKVELHAHLNGSISPGTMTWLVKLNWERWPEETMPDNTDLIIQGGEYGSSVTDDTKAVRMVTQDVIPGVEDNTPGGEGEDVTTGVLSHCHCPQPDHC